MTRVTVPARSEYVRVLRTMAADAAVSADLSFDRYSDLELAVGEASAMLLELGPENLSCELHPSAGRVEVELDGAGAEATSTPDELAQLVIEAVADEVAIDLAATPPTVRVVVGAVPVS